MIILSLCGKPETLYRTRREEEEEEKRVQRQLVWGAPPVALSTVLNGRGWESTKE